MGVWLLHRGPSGQQTGNRRTKPLPGPYSPHSHPSSSLPSPSLAPAHAHDPLFLLLWPQSPSPCLPFHLLPYLPHYHHQGCPRWGRQGMAGWGREGGVDTSALFSLLGTAQQRANPVTLTLQTPRFGTGLGWSWSPFPPQPPFPGCWLEFGCKIRSWNAALWAWSPRNWVIAVVLGHWELLW